MIYKLFIDSDTYISFKDILSAVLYAEKKKIYPVIFYEKLGTFRVYSPFLTLKTGPAIDFKTENDALIFIGSILC